VRRGGEFCHTKRSPCILVVKSVCVLRVTSICMRYIIEFMHMHCGTIINVIIINVYRRFVTLQLLLAILMNILCIDHISLVLHTYAVLSSAYRGTL